MKKIIVIVIVIIAAVSAFGFSLKPSVTTEDNSQVASAKTGAEKSGFTSTTSW